MSQNNNFQYMDMYALMSLLSRQHLDEQITTLRTQLAITDDPKHRYELEKILIEKLKEKADYEKPMSKTAYIAMILIIITFVILFIVGLLIFYITMSN